MCLPLVLQTNCVLNKNVTRCCRRTWRLPSRIFKTCNIPFSFTYNIVYYTVHIPTYKSWTTSHNLVMGRVSYLEIRVFFYLIIDPSLKNSNFEITELLYDKINFWKFKDLHYFEVCTPPGNLKSCQTISRTFFLINDESILICIVLTYTYKIREVLFCKIT